MLHVDHLVNRSVIHCIASVGNQLTRMIPQSTNGWCRGNLLTFAYHSVIEILTNRTPLSTVSTSKLFRT